VFGPADRDASGKGIECAPATGALKHKSPWAADRNRALELDGAPRSLVLCRRL